MTAPTMTTEAAAYLASVEHELADLPADERAELLEDLAMHLMELEEEHDVRPLEARLGTSESYAAELRTAAGLPPRSTPKGPRIERLTALVASVTEHRFLTAVRGFLPELRPAWWVLRGYLLILVPCVLNSSGRGFLEYVGGPFRVWRARADFPVPAPFDSHWLGLLMVVVAVVVSVRIGRKGLRGTAAAAVVLINTGLVLATVFLGVAAIDAIDGQNRPIFVNAPVVSYPLTSTYGPVTNIFPFSADGKPLTGVLLYDQDGRPLHPSLQEWWDDRCTRVLAQPKAADGVPVPQSYPQQYVLDPRGVTMDGGPVGPGQCRVIAPPTVPLPVFAKTPR